MLVGRKEEIALLKRAYDSSESEFVAVYGRRRVGKTYLIRNVFDGVFTFQHTGIFNVPNKDQLAEFYHSMLAQGLGSDAQPPKTWLEAFHLLEDLITQSPHKRKVVFIDELPWIDAPNSRFMAAFEHFWNGRASARKDVLLIICGSATSWIINKIFRNKGGLYNRVTYKILLQQFSLGECEELATSLSLPLSRSMIIEGYMAMGGIPYYWSKLSPAKSMGQNINDLFFKRNGLLRHEFESIYASMFKSPDKYIKVVEALSGKKSGLTRDEIIARGKLESSGQLSSILEDLIECGFVRKYCHLDKKLKDAIYQLVDCYTLFYYRFIKDAYEADSDYWAKLMQTPAYHTWCGLAFERVCLLHTRQIKAALGISGIMANLFSWHAKKTDAHPGVQIDLIIDRADNVVNVCEMKYAREGYRLTADELKKINTKIGVLKLYLPRHKFAQAVLVASNGVVRNACSDEIPLKVSGEQLFLM